MAFNKGHKSQSHELRTDNRYPVETDVVLISGNFNGKFRTQEVSGGGFSTKQSVPVEFTKEMFEFVLTYVTSSRKKIELAGTCELIPQTLNRFRVVDPADGLRDFLDQIWG